MLLLNESAVRRVLPMADVIAAMEGALAQFSSGEAQQPLRTVMQIGAERSWFGVMSAYIPSPEALGTKLVTVFARNSERGLPTHMAGILLLDPETGAPLALLDGRYITEARTAAVSAVSAKHLGTDGDLAIIGSGVQARSHLEALPHVRQIGEARVWSPTPAHREQFASDMGRHVPCAVRACDTAEEAARGASLIVVATAAAAPVIQTGWVAPGAHVIAVGACRPDQRELDPHLIRRARLYVDSRAAALAESGDVLLAIAEGLIDRSHIVAELGEVVAGTGAGRRTKEEVTIFKSLGMAVEDVAAARLAYRRAIDEGIGQLFDIDS
jgi:alanine dehydrogenase